MAVGEGVETRMEKVFENIFSQLFVWVKARACQNEKRKRGREFEIF